MNPPGSVEDLKNYILREIPKIRFMDFGLLYENDEGEYVVLNDDRMADIRLASLVLLALFTLACIACLLRFCVALEESFRLCRLKNHENSKEGGGSH